MVHEIERLTNNRTVDAYLKLFRPFARHSNHINDRAEPAVFRKMADHPFVELIVSASESLTAAGYFLRYLDLIYSRMVKIKIFLFFSNTKQTTKLYKQTMTSLLLKFLNLPIKKKKKINIIMKTNLCLIAYLNFLSLSPTISYHHTSKYL